MVGRETYHEPGGNLGALAPGEMRQGSLKPFRNLGWYLGLIERRKARQTSGTKGPQVIRKLVPWRLGFRAVTVFVIELLSG